ncbi:spore germination protein, partial [Priestia megaterium]|uniref:spore germination protein n=1 Tax=Priestia megaterium TaxID=1404 RepID=UPI001649C39B
VAGLVIRTPIVQATLLSNIIIILIPLTPLSSFLLPSNEISTTLPILTFPIIIPPPLFPYFPILFLLLLILIHLLILQSITIPY